MNFSFQFWVFYLKMESIFAKDYRETDRVYECELAHTEAMGGVFPYASLFQGCTLL